MKLYWEEQVQSGILCQKSIQRKQLGPVKQRLKHKKVLTFLMMLVQSPLIIARPESIDNPEKPQSLVDEIHGNSSES